MALGDRTAVHVQSQGSHAAPRSAWLRSASPGLPRWARRKRRGRGGAAGGLQGCAAKAPAQSGPARTARQSERVVGGNEGCPQAVLPLPASIGRAALCTSIAFLVIATIHIEPVIMSFPKR
jgi:hypothetical protein